MEALRGSVGYIKIRNCLASSLTKAFLGRIEEIGVSVFGVRVAEEKIGSKRIKMVDDDMQIGAKDYS